MTKIYLLLFFYLLKIDFCGMEDEKDNNNIINENDIIGKLCSYKDKKIPNQIQKPKYDREIGDLFKIEDFKFRKKNEQNENNNIINENAFNNQENEEGINNEVNNILGEIEAENPNILQNIRDKEGIFDRINIADDYNEGNIVECCCFVSRESVYRVKETSRKYFDENQYLKRSGKDIVDLNKDYRNALKNKYKKLLKKEKEKEEVINQREDYEEELKDQITNIEKSYKSLLDYDKGLANNFEAYNNDYLVINDYYNEGKKLANDSINKIKELIFSLKQKENEIKKLETNIDIKKKENEWNIKVIEEKEKRISNLNTEKVEQKNKIDSLISENKNLSEALIKKDNDIGKLNSQIIDLNNNIINKDKQKRLDDIKNEYAIAEINKEKNRLEKEIKLIKDDKISLEIQKNQDINNLREQYDNLVKKNSDKEKDLCNQIEGLKNKIKELEIEKSVCEVEKNKLENEKIRLNEDIISKNKDIDNLRKDNNLLQEKNLELSTKYNQNLQEIKDKNNKLFQGYMKEVGNSNNRYNELYQAITKLNLDWYDSFNVFNKKSNEKFENIIKSNENFNQEKQKNFETTINTFIEEQKKMIEDINESNNEKLKKISNYYNTTVKDFEKKYNETLKKIEEQATNYEKAVKELETTLRTDSTNNSTEIVKSITNLTYTISDSFKKTQNELNEQKNQFSKDVENLGDKINKVIGEKVSEIKNNVNLQGNNINEKVTNLSQKNMTEFNKTAKNFEEVFKQKNEEYIKSNASLNNSLNTLNQNINQWYNEKESLKTINEDLKKENENLKEQIVNLNSKLSKKEQEYSLLNKEKENLNSNYNKLQGEIKKIGEELIGEEENENENEENYAYFTLQKTIKNKIKELQEKNKLDEANLKNLKEKNKQLNDENHKLNEEKYNAMVENLKAEKKAVNKEIELFKMQFNNIKNTNVENKNENEKIGQENIKKIKEEIKKLEENIEKKFENAKQVAVLESKNKALEEQISAQTEQLKAAASGYDLKEQQEFDNYANKTRQENIRKILNDANIGDKMKRNSDNKNENEILKEEYYLPFIFEDYNINNKWICLEKYTACKYKSNLNMGNKGNIALEKNELIYDKDLVYNNFNEVLFENLERSKEFKKINLENIASEKLKIKIPSQNDKKNEKQNEEEEENFKVEKVVVDSYKDYNIYIRKGKNEILLGNYFCETAVEILKNFPNADLYLLFIENICYFYLKETPLQKFMEYCAFVQGCSLATRIKTYGEYLSMYINDIVTGSAAIERNNFKYFTKEDLQSIFSSLFSNRWFKAKDISWPKLDGDFIPEKILSYPELLIKPLNKNEYTASKIIEKKLQHPYIEKKIETKVREYGGNTVFWYKCDMQDPVTYLLSECIGLGNYGYIGRFYKRDGQGNYYPVALKLTLDSATHDGGSHKAIMKEIKAGKAAAVMGCNRMIYSNRAGLIELNNSNFIKNIAENKFSNMFLNPLQFIEGEKQMGSNNKEYKKLLLAEQKFGEFSDIYFRKDKKMNIEKWNDKKLKKEEDYNYRINFLEKRFKDFYNSEKFKKFHNLMFNEDNKVQNTLLYVMEMDIIDEKDEDLYTETTTEKTKNNEENEKKEENIEQNNEIKEEDKEIDINDDIKYTINNIAEYLTAQYKCGVIHGDIKAKNMTKNKFLDFGSFDMVTNYETNTKFSDVVGTPEYWDLVRIFNKQLELVAPYDVLLKDYQLSDLYASIVALYYYMFKEYPAFATLIIIIKSILKHYINDVNNNNDYCKEGYEKDIEKFIDRFPTGEELVECTKAFEKDKKLKKQINKDIKDDNVLKEEKKEEEKKEGENKNEEKEEKEVFLNKFNKYLKEVEDKNYLIEEVEQLRYCIYLIIQKSLLTIDDVKDKNVDKDKLFFIMSKKKEFYSKGERGLKVVKKFSEEVVEKLIGIYKDLRKKELENIEKLTKSKDEKKNMLGRIMYQILQQGTFANSKNYPAFEVYKNEHSYNNEAKGKEDYRRDNLEYRTAKEELIKKIRNKDDQVKIKESLKEYKGFWDDYEERLSLRKKSYLYTLEPLSIKSLITQQPYYQYKKSFINVINEEKEKNEEKK